MQSIKFNWRIKKNERIQSNVIQDNFLCFMFGGEHFTNAATK